MKVPVQDPLVHRDDRPEMFHSTTGEGRWDRLPPQGMIIDGNYHHICPCQDLGFLIAMCPSSHRDPHLAPLFLQNLPLPRPQVLKLGSHL